MALVLRTLALVLLVACSTLRDDLGRAETGYDSARYEDALVWLNDIEPSTARLGAGDRARFYYLRGMVALRLEDRNAALHYLALAREEAEEAGGGLRDEWQETLEPTLEELSPTTATHLARPGEE